MNNLFYANMKKSNSKKSTLDQNIVSTKITDTQDAKIIAFF